MAQEAEPLLDWHDDSGDTGAGTGASDTGARRLDGLTGTAADRGASIAAGAGAGAGAGTSGGGSGAMEVPGQGLMWTTKIDRALPLKMGSGLAGKPPSTVVEHFRETVRRHGGRIALRVKREGVWKEWTYHQYHAQVTRFARALLAVGLERFDAVAIMGFNSPEWVMANIGTIAAGGVVAGVYTTNNADACQYIAEHSGAVVAVVEDAKQLQKFLDVRHSLPMLKAIVVYNDPTAGAGIPGVYGWQEFMAKGVDTDEHDVTSRMASQRPEHCCALIYTSGTTGRPKGVMLSHDNITWTAKVVLDTFAADETEHLVSYLPLSHIAAAMLDVYGPAIVGFTVSFARPDALKGSLVETLKEVQPTILFGVPRVYEKIHEKMAAFGRRNNWLLRQIAAWAKGVGLRAARATEKHEAMPWGFWLARVLVFNNVRRALGLANCRAQFSGAAPMAPETLRYFQSLMLPVNELYGMSECTGPQTVNFPGSRQTETAGKPMPGTEVRIVDTDASGSGELAFRGRNVFMGYLNDVARTAAAVDAEGFLRSGDLGRFNNDGFVVITGRRKEIIVTAGGENVAPVPVENRIKEELPCISHAMLVGDRRRFVSCLLTLKTVIDEDTGIPSDQLDAPALHYMKTVAPGVKTVGTAMTDPQLREAIDAAIERVNATAVSRASQVRKWILLPAEFSVPTGELTPTLKLKRSVVEAQYSGLISGMYGVGGAADGVV